MICSLQKNLVKHIIGQYIRELKMIQVSKIVIDLILLTFGVKCRAGHTLVENIFATFRIFKQNVTFQRPLSQKFPTTRFLLSIEELCISVSPTIFLKTVYRYLYSRKIWIAKPV